MLFRSVATVDGHVTAVKVLTAGSVTTSATAQSASALLSNYFYVLTNATTGTQAANMVLWFHKATNAFSTTTTGLTTTTGVSGTFNHIQYQNNSVAHLSGITGLGTGANQLDVTDIVLF